MSASRRGYGSGSLSVRETKNGDMWDGRFYDARGKRVTRVVGPKRARGSRVGLTRKEAEAALRKLISKHRPQAPGAEGLTLVDAALDYVDHLQLLGRKPWTIRNYRVVVNRHLTEFFGTMPITAVDVDDVEDFRLELLRAKKLAPDTVAKHLTFLHGVFKYARKRRWTTYNPVADVDRPARIGANPDIRFLDEEELEALLRVRPGMLVAHVSVRPSSEQLREVMARYPAAGRGRVAGAPTNWSAIGRHYGVSATAVRKWWRADELARRAGRALPAGDIWFDLDRTLWLVAALTGLRQGELIGLRWIDVDWAAGVIRVRRTYTCGEWGTPKSRRSSRAVPMAYRVQRELELHSQRSSFRADEDLVFANPRTGEPLDASALRRRFKRAVKGAGVREIRFHDLRHTFGTRMAAAGTPMRSLQEWLGHRHITTTEIYADYAPDPTHGAVWVARAFGEAPGAETVGQLPLLGEPTR
jgi:integrase